MSQSVASTEVTPFGRVALRLRIAAHCPLRKCSSRSAYLLGFPES